MNSFRNKRTVRCHAATDEPTFDLGKCLSLEAYQGTQPAINWQVGQYSGVNACLTAALIWRTLARSLLQQVGTVCDANFSI
jgi:hypothetical protein